MNIMNIFNGVAIAFQFVFSTFDKSTEEGVYCIRDTSRPASAGQQVSSKNINADYNSQQRINPNDVKEINKNTADNDCERRKRIAQLMQVS